MPEAKPASLVSRKITDAPSSADAAIGQKDIAKNFAPASATHGLH